MSKKIIFLVLLLMAVGTGLSIAFVFKKFHRSQNSSTTQKPKLVIYSYSSFIDSLGPGPEIIKKFESQCLCDVEVHDVGSGALLIERMKLAPERQVDLVIGLDQLNLKNAARAVKWKTLRMPPRDWVDEVSQAVYSKFVPFDWSPMTFLTQEKNSSYKNLNDFFSHQKKKSVALQDAELSSPGLQFLYWFWLDSKKNRIDWPNAKKSLMPYVHSFSSEWSGSYSLFQSGAAPQVFTYLTSIVYHREKNESLGIVEIESGHPAQIEYVGVPEQCLSCGLAESFIQLMTEADSQSLIAQKNFMLPVIKNVELNAFFNNLPKLKIIDSSEMDLFVDSQKEILNQWKAD